MISYDNYKNRIEKLAKVKRVLHKFRFLICGVLVLIVGVAAGLMAAKGTYTSGMSLSAQTVTFNEPYEVTPAKAFLASPSEQRVEYCKEGSGEWTTKKPVKAGTYSARTVTKKLVGYSYSSSVQFTILPIAAEFSVSGSSVVYGEAPAYTLTSLVSGHRVDESALQFEYADYGAASTEVSAVESSLKIVDASGDDFTDCYAVTFSGKTLDIRSRNLTVTPSSYQYAYDGGAHTSTNDVSSDTKSGLAKGDTISVVSSVYDNLGTRLGGAVNAGSYPVKIDSVKIMHGETDVTAHYNLGLRPSQLVINARTLTVTTGGGEKEYDGAPLVNTHFECDNLVAGHTASVDTSSLPEAEDAGTYKNEFKVFVFDGATDVTANYQITVNAGTLKITPYKLTVTTPDAKKTYDGTPISNDRFTLGEAPEGFDFVAVSGKGAQRVDFGKQANEFAVKITKKADGRVVTHNFDINYVYGTLEIEKRALAVKTGSLGITETAPYNGEAQSNAVPETYSGLLTELGHELRVDRLCTVKDVTAAGGADNTTTYTVWGGGRNLSENYSIAYTYGKLIITPRHITVTTNDAYKIYDGTPLSDSGYTTDIVGGGAHGLYNSDKLAVAGDITEITNAGTAINVCSYTVPSANYFIDRTEYGTLTVGQKTVNVTINGAGAVYGEDIPDNGFTLDCGALPNGETLTFATNIERGGTTYTPEKWQGYTLLNAGGYLIALTEGTQKITGGNAKLDNYNLQFISGSLNITQRVIYYQTATDQKIYDGTALVNTDYKTFLASDSTKAGLLKDDKLTVRNNPTGVVRVEERRNANYYDLPNANYLINQAMSEDAFGTLKVTARPVIVYTASDIKPYDGQPLENSDYTVKYAVEKDGKWVADDAKAGLVSRDGVKDSLALIGESVKITDAGEKPNANRYNNPDYEVKAYVDGTLKIEQKRVEIKIGTETAQYGYEIYDRIYQQNAGYRRKDGLSANVLAGTEILELKVGFKKDGGILNKFEDSLWHLSVGTYAVYAVEYMVKDGSGTYTDSGKTLKNYDITCDEGALSITPRSVTVDIKSGTAKYGEDVSEKVYGFDLDCTLPVAGAPTETELPYGEQLSLTYKYDRQVKDVGDYDVLADKVFIDGTQIDPDNCNYSFTFNKGTLTVEQKDLKVYLYHYDTAENIDYGDLWSYTAGKGNYTKADGLVSGEELEIAVDISGDGSIYFDEAAGKYRLGAGNYQVSMTGGKIYVGGTEKTNGLNNYAYTFEKGVLAVSKKNLAVTFTNDVNKVEYGDSLASYKPAYTTNLDGAMPYNETFEIGGYTYLSGGVEAPEKKPVGEYAIQGKNLTFKDSGGNPITGGASNYQITYSGVLTVNKKQVNIRLVNEELEYGREDQIQGLQAQGTGYVRVDGKTENALAYGETLSIGTGYKQSDRILSYDTVDGKIVWRLPVGDYTRYATEFYVKENPDDNKWIDSGSVLKNYEITCETAAFKITPYMVTVQPNDNSCFYGDNVEDIVNTFKYADAWTISQDGLPYGENLILSYSYDPSTVKDAGTYKIIGTATGVDGGSLTNYDVAYNQGTLTVNPRKIYVVIDDKNECVYGKTPANVGYKIYLTADGEGDEYALPNGDVFTADLDYYKYGDPAKTTVTPKNAGSYGIKVVKAYINGAETQIGEAAYAGGNYVIEVVDGKLTVKPKTVTVVLNAIGEVTYGDTFSYAAGVDNYANAAEAGLEYGERLEVAVKYLIDGEDGAPKNANYSDKTHRYTCAYSARLNKDACKVYQSDGVTEIGSGAANYDFVCDDLENLKIKQFAFAIKPLEFTKANDNALTYGDTLNYPDNMGNYDGLRSRDVTDSYDISRLPYGEQIKILDLCYVEGGIVKPFPDKLAVKTHCIMAKNIAIYDSENSEIQRGDQFYNFTNYNYVGSDVSDLEVVPRTVKVVLNSYEMEYGEFKIGDYGTFVYPDGKNNYNLAESDSLAYGEQLKVQVKYQQLLDGSQTDVNPKDVGSYKIVVADCEVFDGETPADKENYLFSYEAGDLDITQKRISVEISKLMGCDYGEALPETEYYLADKNGAKTETLPYGDRFTAVFEYYSATDPAKEPVIEPKNAGRYGITVETAYVNDAVTALYSPYRNYYITVNDGELNIAKADVHIALNSLPNVYYGKTPTYGTGVNNYDLAHSTALASGEQLEVKVTFTNPSGVAAWNCGTYTIGLDGDNSIVHVGATTMPLSTNYNVTGVTAGYVTVAPRAVAVKFIDRAFEYGSGSAGNEDFSITVDISDDGTLSATELPNGEILSFKNSYEKGGKPVTPKNAGSYTIKEGTVKVNGSEAGAGNYSFSYTYATLTISKKTVEITLNDINSTYGDFCTVNEDGSYTVTLPQTGTVRQTDGSDNEILANDEELTVSIKFTEVGKENSGEFVMPKNAGTYSVVATLFTVTSNEEGVYEGGKESGAGNALTNYTINCGHGTLNIAKRQLTVDIDDNLRSTYAEDLPAITYKMTSGGAKYALPYDDTLQIDYYFQDNEGTIYRRTNPPENAGTYEIVLDGAAINLGSGNGNYDISRENGTLNIKSRPITVTVHGNSCTYGYEKFPEIKFDVKDNGKNYLPNGEKLVPAFEFGLNGEWFSQPVNAGVYRIAVDESECKVEGGNARYQNYAVTYAYRGSLTIKQMPLTVTVGSASITYGEPLPAIPCTVTQNGAPCTTLPHGDVLKLAFKYKNVISGVTTSLPEAAGQYIITAVASIEGGNERIENYAVTYKSADPAGDPTLTILQKQIEIKLNADGKVSYIYGENFDDKMRTAEITGGVAGQTINVAVTYKKAQTERVASLFAMRALAAAAGEDGAFMPKNVGKYVASLDWNNCTVTDENGSVVGGIGNYKLKDGFVCNDVEFEIKPMTLTVTVENAEATYGEALPEIKYDVAETMPGGESLNLTFSLADGEGNLPVHKGDYPINIVGKAVDGGEIGNYTLNFTNPAPMLKIKAKPITIRVSDMSAPFDTDYTYEVRFDNYNTTASDKLVDGDKLKVTGVTFTDALGNEIGDRADAGEYVIVFNNYEIVNADGEDVTADYQVTRLNGTLTIKGNLIIIYTGSDEKEYDGTALTCNAFTYSGALAEGYQILPERTFGVTEVTAAGGVDNTAKFKIVDKNGLVTENYEIKYGLDGKTYGKLKVTQRKIEIVSQSATRDYNGEELTAPYQVYYKGSNAGSPAIALTDTLKATAESIIDAGSKTNTVTYKILGEGGKDVTANYAVSKKFGVLTVSKKSVEVTIKMGNAIYGVEPLISHETNVPLAEGETLSFDVSYKNKSGQNVVPDTTDGYFKLNVGDYRAYYVADSAEISGGRANAENYSFVFALGAQFKITERHIWVTTPTPEAHEYDGNYFYNHSDYTTEWVIDGVEQGLIGLLEGELDVTSYTKRADAGSELNICAYTAPANYKIDGYTYGMLTVSRRTIAVKTADITETYDGQPHSDGTLTYNALRLVSGHRIEVVSDLVEQTDYTTGVDNELEIAIKDAGGNDVTANYAVTLTFGTIIINKRPLDVTTGSFNGVYNGTPRGNTVAANIGSGLLTDLGHELVVLKEITYTNATEGVDNKTTYKVMCGATDLSHNYHINYTYGKIVIEKAVVTVTLKEGVRAEYGDDYAELLAAGAVTLVNDETAELKIDFDRAVDGIGTYTATVDWNNSLIKDKNGVTIEDGALNYAATVVPATRTFEVIARNITVTLNADGVNSFVYGSDYDAAMCKAATSGLAEGEELSVSVVYRDGGTLCTPEDVGEYTAELDDWTVIGGNKANYNVTSCEDVTFNITQKDLTVYMDDLTVAYGGTLEYPEGVSGYIGAAGLLSGQTLNVTPAFERGGAPVEPQFAGTYDIVCGGITVADARGAVNSNNYKIKTGRPYGTLTIEGVSISVVRKTVTKPYDGEKLMLSANAPASEVDYVINGTEGLRLESGYNLVLDGEFGTANGNVQSMPNTANYKVVDASGNTAGNYVVTYADTDAMLVISKRTIAVTTFSATRKYNGLPLTAGCTYNEADLVSGHTLSFMGKAAITDVGSTPNTTTVVIKDAGGVAVTGNYFIDWTEGTLTVEKLPVNVPIANINKVYGEDINVNRFTLNCDLVNSEKLNFRVHYTDGANVYDGSTRLGVGEYGIAADPDSAIVTGGRGKATNYEFTYATDAKLYITERHIIVNTPTPAAHEYDGNDFYNYSDYSTVWVKDGVKKGVAGLLDGELTVTSYAKRAEVGSEQNICAYTAPANYIIDGYTYGTLEVKKRTISVKTADITTTYDGQMHSDDTFTHDESKLLAGHTIAVVGEPTGRRDATDGINNVLNFKITNASGGDETGNYRIVADYGTIVINKRALTVTLNKGGVVEFAYGDSSFDGKFKEVTAAGLVGGETLEVALVYSTADGSKPKNAGSYTASLDTENSYVTYVGEGNGIGNYEITCADVAFEITPKNITVTLGEWAAEEYDGGEHVYDTSKFAITAGSLYDGESIANVAVKYCKDTAGTTNAGTPVNAGTYYVLPDLANTLVSGADGTVAISVNYQVNFDYLTFTVTPRKFTITLADATHVYDGKQFDYANSGSITTTLCEGDEIEYNVTYSATPVNADDYTVTFDSNIVFTSGEAGNYRLDEENSKLSCTLKINRRQISVTVADRNVEKGNEEYTKAHLSSMAADGGAGFVNGDLDKAEVQFIYTDKAGAPLNAVAYKNVSVTFGGAVMGNYNVTAITDGTLTVTERKVLVTPVFNGETPYVYDGNAVDSSLFGYTHVHNIQDCAEDDLYGFTAEHAASFTATYRFTNTGNGTVISGTPKNAGTYTVSVVISGAGINSYLVEYETAEFTIVKRPLSYTLQVEGAGEYTYSNSRPAFTAQLTEHNGFISGIPADMAYELIDGEGAVATRYNVGAYKVGIDFNGIENYDITANEVKITIVPRVLVITPVDPYGGVAQTYDGTNLTLGSYDYAIRSGEVASGDALTIRSTQLAPTARSGNLTIAEVIIRDVYSGADVAANYTVYSVYNATNTAITDLGLRAYDFRVRAEYTQTEIHYTLADLSVSYPYNGEKRTYSFYTDSATLSAGETLDFGHYVKLSQNYVTVPVAAGVYDDLITKLVRIYDPEGRDVTVIYNLVCDNPEAGKISVTENVLSIDLSGVDVSTLSSGRLDCTVSGLYEGASPAHTAEVYAYDLDGEWLIGAVVFSTSETGNRTDLSANYKLSETSVLSGATVKIITLAQAEEYSRPALGVEITATAADLAGGKGTAYTLDSDGRWVLGESYYTVSGELQAGHTLQVLVFVENDNYLLGVTVFSTVDGRRKEAKNSYRLREIITADVAASYVAVADVADKQRELYIDFSGSFNADGTPKVENGLLTGYVAEGLNVADEHVLEVTTTDNGDGTYTLTAVIYQLRRQGASYKKFNKAAAYKLVCTAPAGVTVVTGTVS